MTKRTNTTPAPDATSTPTDAELEALVAAGDVTATVDGAEVPVVAIDLANSPPLDADAQDGDPSNSPPPDADADGSAAPVRVRELVGGSLVLGAPGTISKQREDGTWYAAEPGDE